MELQRDFYVGIVEDNKDPNRKGRIKVRVQTLYHNIPVEDIPYAYPFTSLAGKEFQVPAIGKLVNVLFLSDDLYSPYYIYSENYNENLQRKLKSLSDDEYVDFSALIFDESTNIFVKGKELTVDQLLNKMTINNTSINLELKDNQQILNLGSRGADQDAVLGTRFFEWMDKFIKEVMNPSAFIGNLGAPVLKPMLDALCQEYQLLRPDFVSNNVKVVDNGEVKKLSRDPGIVNNKNDIDLVVPEEELAEHRNALINAIQSQNEKACNQLKNAAASDIVPLNGVNSDPKIINYIWPGRQTKNKIEGLHPNMKQYAAAFVNKCKSAGIKIEVTSGIRSIESQQALQSTGNAAKPGFSYHNYGLAIDIKLVNSNDWDTVGKIGESLGFRWGKHFRSPRSERWHFDMGFGHTTAELRQKLDRGDVIDGYVNLGPSIVPEQNLTGNQQLNGQDYLINSDVASNSSSINDPCKGMDKFNRTDAEKIKNNSNGQSDEREPASSKKEEDAAAKADAAKAETSAKTNTNECTQVAAKSILDRIAKGEGTDDAKAIAKGYESGYDVTFNYGKNGMPDTINGKPTDPITNLTIGEIKQVQEIMKTNNSMSTAMGKYQIISKTLPEIQAACGLSDDTIFSPEIQDMLGTKLLDRRGFNKWISGSKNKNGEPAVSDQDFQTGLAKEWASIADPQTGKSRYNQKVGTSDDDIKLSMKSARDQSNGCA